MAVISPRSGELAQLPVPLNEGERQVLQCLALLDDEWLVYVQPRIGLDQPDFVVVHPDFGVCVIEVKDWALGAYSQGDDGRISVRSGGGWQLIDEAPRYQAHRYRTSLHDRAGALIDHPPGIVAVRGVVVLPRCTTRQANALLRRATVDGVERFVKVYGGDDIEADPWLVLTDSRSPRRKHSPEGWIAAVHRTLAEPECVSDLRLPLPLSTAAGNIASNPNDATIRRVRGAAGSGKSLGLAARAARLAKDGQDVLVVTYNSTLPHYLRDLAARHCRELGASLGRITFTHFFELCKRAVDDARVAGAEPQISTLPGLLSPYEVTLQQGIEAYRMGHGPRFDAVLVDEGQDFTLEWWNTLRYHVRRADGEMLLVADPTQDVYGKRAWTDEQRMLGAGFSGQWTTVDGSYRLPADLAPIVAEFARRHLGEDRIEPVVPAEVATSRWRCEPTVRRWINAQVGESSGRRVGQEVVRLLQEHPDLAPADVVFLVDRHDEGLRAVEVIEAAGFPVQHIFAKDERERGRLKRRFWAANGGVKGCTTHSFKGWEARAVVMATGWGEGARELAYVGLTRVKGDRMNRSAYITVVNTDFGLRGFQHRFERAG